MGKLIYSAIASLDGYVEDRDGNFDWAAPEADVRAFINESERPLATCLYGRHMYEKMLPWETIDTGPEQEPVVREFAEIWRAKEKIVYSRTLDRVRSANTRIEQDFEPTAVQRLKASRAHDIGVGGADLAAEALEAGLVDEIRLFTVPVLVGDGRPVLPRHLRLELELREARPFDSGVVHLRYRVRD